MSTITEDLDLAVAYLRQGNLVAIPTETVYGLAANAEDEEAIKKVYALKKRPLNHPLIMHVAPDWDLSQWVSFIPDYARVLMKEFWPGPLTLVFHSKSTAVSPSITGGQSTVAIRCPNHPLTENLLRKLNCPLVAPSANPFGKISPTTAQHVQHSFSSEELLILDGGRCAVGIESSIISAVNPTGYQILRHGTIDEAQIKALLPNQQLQDTSSLRVPGNLKQHYQPKKPLFCFQDPLSLAAFCKGSSAYLLSFADFANTQYRFANSPEKVAFELYYQLRKADESSADCIAIELPPDEEQWQGIRERIIKASQPP